MENAMGLILGLFAVFAVLVVIGACRVSGDASRQEEAENAKIEKGRDSVEGERFSETD